MNTLLRVEIRQERDVVLARHQAKLLANEFGFESQDQIRIATAVSEITRNALQHAGGGTVEFLVQELPTRELIIQVHDQGPGIARVQDVLTGISGVGNGIVAARRVMDQLEIDSNSTGTLVTLSKTLPRRSAEFDLARQTQLTHTLESENSQSIFQEFQAQNQDLLKALGDLRKHQFELKQVNEELEETNRGVVALYAQLEEKAESLQQLHEQKSRFYSSVSHELRTPINSILSLARILLDRLDGELTPEQQRQVQFIEKAAQNLREWINDLLDIAKAEAGKIPVECAPFSVEELLLTLRGMMRPLIANPQVELIIEEPPPALQAVTDENKLSQILRNLVSNAIKFTEQGEIHVRVTTCEADSLQFEISDTGIGIASDDVPLIFEDFVQVSHPLQKMARGTGLGLPLSKRFTKLLGGTLELTSEVGVGSRFTVTIPRVYQTQPETEPSPTPQPAQPTTQVALPRVLIIDDDETARYVVSCELTKYGVDVVEATNGRRGIALAQEIRPQLIVLDLTMPDLNGLEVLAALRENESTDKIPVILRTSTPLTELHRPHLQGVIAVVGKDATQGLTELQRALQSIGLTSGDHVTETQRV